MEGAEEKTVEAVQPTEGNRENAIADGTRTGQIDSPVAITPRQKTVPVSPLQKRSEKLKGKIS